MPCCTHHAGTSGYRWGFEVHGDDGRPVAGSAQARALMANITGGSYDEVLRLWDREVARYPQHFRAHWMRWRFMHDHDPRPRVVAQIRSEQERLRRRFPDRAEAWWYTASLSGRDRDLTTVVRDRFPDSEWADEAAYWLGLLCRRDGEREAEVAALRRLITGFPGSPYVDEAYRQLLISLMAFDPPAAISLADSLIERRLRVPWSRGGQARQRFSASGRFGLVPEGLAYSVRFALHLEQGDTTAAIRLARRLSCTEVPDPMPYLYIGKSVASGRPTGLVTASQARCPVDRNLALRILEAGARKAAPSSLLGMPGYGEYFGMPEHTAGSWRQLYREGIARLQRDFSAALAALSQPAPSTPDTRVASGRQEAFGPQE